MGTGAEKMSYTLKSCPANPQNYSGRREARDIKYLVYHYTANDGDSDEGNGNYFAQHIVQASAHYFVDDDSVTRSVPDLYVVWSVGGAKWKDCEDTGGGTFYGKCANTNSISIEMCDTQMDGKYGFTEKTLANAAELGAELMKKYGIPAERVIRHFDVNGKHCPGVSGWWGKSSPEWAKFKERLARKMAEVMHNGYKVNDKLLDSKGHDNIPQSWSGEAIKWGTENGIICGDEHGDLLLRAPLTREAFLVMLKRFAKQ